MHKNLCFLALFLAPGLLWSQVEPSASGGSGDTSDDSPMSMPPQASGAFYPVAVGAGLRSNVLSAGVLVTGAYDDNVLAGETANPVAAESVIVLPSIRIDAKTPRFGGGLSYSPGFMYYTPTTELNQVTQNAIADFHYRWTPHTTISVQEVFRQNSTVFSQPYTFSGTTISGSGNPASPIVIVPYAGQITESTNGHLGYQISRSAMLGVSGSFSTYRFSNTAQTEGLDNSNVESGSAFYTRRLTRTQYVGVSYSYALTHASPYPFTTKSQTASVIYDLYLGSGFSLSLKGGPEYTSSSTPGSPATNEWDPSGSAGIGWSRTRTSFALNYSRAVTTGWGLLGSYTADSAGANLSHQFTRRLTGGANGNYGNTKNATPLLVSYSATGHTLFGRASLEYLLGEHLRLVGEYAHIHTDYSGISALSNSPSDNRVGLTLNYQFEHPLGR